LLNVTCFRFRRSKFDHCSGTAVASLAQRNLWLFIVEIFNFFASQKQGDYGYTLSGTD